METNVKPWNRIPSFDEYYSSKYNSRLDVQFVKKQYLIMIRGVRRGRYISLFENYFNRKTGGYKEFQFHNALDLLLWERGFSIVFCGKMFCCRKWQKGKEFFWVNSSKFGEDSACFLRIPFANIESVFNKEISWWNHKNS